jgi:MFS family permease
MEASTPLSARTRAFMLFALIVSGEAVFFLPFVIPRVFRPTFLEVFHITNLQLGSFISVYGVVAMVAYFFGGPLADRYPARLLMALALFSTALGGLVLWLVPDPIGMFWLYGCWGATTILLFWAALMRATRTLGGARAQGTTFGTLDGGRGLVAAVVGSLAVAVFAWFLPADLAHVGPAERIAAFRKVILFFSACVFGSALLVFAVLRPLEQVAEREPAEGAWTHLRQVLRLPAVWLQAVIIVCAYSGYRIADDFPLLAKDVLGYNEVHAAGLATMALWIRPVAAVGAGLLADRFSPSGMTLCCFALLLLGGLLIAFGPLGLHPAVPVYFAVVSTALGVFALRGLYFAIMQEGRIPLEVTGTAVGVASVVGFLPDVYMGPVMGVLLDDHPGVRGHQLVFLVLAGFAALGLLATLAFRRVVRYRRKM